MLFPIRCFTCGKVINHLHKTYTILTENENKTNKDALDILNIKRYCCRRMFLTYADTFKYISEFDKNHYNYIHTNLQEIIPIKNIDESTIPTNIDDDEDIVDIIQEQDINYEFIPDDETIVDDYE